MKCVPLFAIIGFAISSDEFTPKKVLVGKVVDLVTGFLNESQISTSIDIIALDIHKMKQPEEILSDVYDYLTSALTTEQLKTINDSYKAMVKDLGEEGSDDVLRRTKMIIAYGVSPAIEKVHANAKTPDSAYTAMSKQLTPDFMKNIVVLVKDTLTPSEWNTHKTFLEKLRKEGEETKDGGQDEARRIINANKDIEKPMIDSMLAIVGDSSRSIRTDLSPIDTNRSNYIIINM
ncbi:hypothetical protein KIN20_035084 [Parelaphostrongylus tenuis]|uniref:Uncharacterized protein n=1 Tax=Parelaphostrongylus tenuis TaxID=148309 RepID=A0AAD5RAL4_PARTN|nr:hypothetical protein KIN20_035084 [Parelaphostrongylus tenuis]